MEHRQEERQPLLEIKHLKTYFPVYGGPLSKLQGYVHAVDDVSLSVLSSETMGIVGESGCGKSTLVQSILRTVKATEGSVQFCGQDVLGMSRQQLQRLRREIQIVYQDPFSSLNPRMSVGESISEPLLVHGIKDPKERRQRTIEIMKAVGLEESYYGRYPHEFSGGQRQRVSIARALVIRPKLILCDEPVSALDVSIQSQILNLLKQLQKEFGLTYVFVSHALNVVRYLSDRICVMYLGKVMELAGTQDLFTHASHPYTKALLSSIPIPDPQIKRERILLKGDIPSPKNPPKGCRFHTRCPLARERCGQEEPELREVSPGHFCACFFVEEGSE